MEKAMHGLYQVSSDAGIHGEPVVEALDGLEQIFSGCDYVLACETIVEELRRRQRACASHDDEALEQLVLRRNRELFAEGCTDGLVGFEWNGTSIHDWESDESLRVSVRPADYYGEAYRNFIAQLRYEVTATPGLSKALLGEEVPRG